MQTVQYNQTDWLDESELTMTVTEREYVALQKLIDDNQRALQRSIDDNHKAIMDMLELRKDYFDRQFSELCRTIKEMKNHCSHTQDQCFQVFKDHEKSIMANTSDIARIKSVGATLMVVWGAVVTLSGYLLRKMGG